MTKINDIIKFIERNFPLTVQESYDNSGFIIGDRNTKIQNIFKSCYPT